MMRPSDLGISRFDIMAGHYAYARDHHTGQWCPLYARLSCILSYFRPGPFGVDIDSDDWAGARHVYDELVSNDAS